VPLLSRPLPKRLGHDEEASLVEHLTELRTRIIICLVTIAAWFVVTFVFRDTLIHWLSRPLDGQGFDGRDLKPITLSPSEPLMTSFNISLWTALALSMPVIVWQTWSFLAPAFEPRSQRAVVRLVVIATLLLAAGMAFAYWVVLPTSINFLLNFDSSLYNVQIRAKEYYGFAAVMIFTIGLLFELPIFIVGLVRLGIISSQTLRRNRRIGYGLCIVAAVLLPGIDFVTMTVQTLPLVALFEISIWASVIAERRAAAAAAELAASQG
jgi:sec-independent protein translocase protein TatC